MTHAVVLPWPPAELNPNKRLHWSVKRKHVKAYREACYLLAKEARLRVPTDGRIALWLDFFPPNMRRFDDDNLVAAFKAGRDGLADALGIDDRRFVVIPFVQTKTHPGGCVTVRLTNMPEREEA